MKNFKEWVLRAEEEEQDNNPPHDPPQGKD